ncbi:MAG: HNH endonuclease [Rectinema sp.]
MRFYVGVTDGDWFKFLRELNPPPEDIDFWQPSSRQPAILKRGEPFLFKLHAPYNKIAGLGFFSTFTVLPLGTVWEAFRERNGAASLHQLAQKIAHYQGLHNGFNPLTLVTGCNILTDPIFFTDNEMIDVPLDWQSNIVRGKYYSTDTIVGAKLWDEVRQRLERRNFYLRQPDQEMESAMSTFVEPQYVEVMSKVRLGQSAFRFMVTEAYHGTCAITADHTLPVLEAAHIKPFAEHGPPVVSNALLLRADLHKLFDDGYMTITPDLHIEVSNALREVFNNGRAYYAFQGKQLARIPEKESERPSAEFLRWHNEHVFEFWKNSA